jgi:hypothetical protein
MRNVALIIGVLGSLCGATVFGGTFTSDFGDPNQPGFTINGGPAIQNGELLMTQNGGGPPGTFVVDDLDTGAAVESFKATFQLKFGPSTTPPADGFSFCFGPNISSSSDFGVEGPGMDAALCVEFDTYDNSAPDNVGIDVKVAGVEIATTTMDYASLVDGQFHNVAIQLNRNGTLNVSWDSQNIYTNVVLRNWNPVSGQFALGASTGFFSEDCAVKNLTVTTTPLGKAVAPSITFQPPATMSLVEAMPLNLNVGFDGSAPLTLQWDLNDTPITGATNSVLKIPLVPLGDDRGKVTCTISNAAGSVTSQGTTLTVTKDTNPPTIKSVVGSDTLKRVIVTFSKPVLAATARIPANYTIAGLTVPVAAPVTSDSTRVVLTTSQQTLGAAYTLIVNNVQDQTSSGNTIATNSQKAFHAFSYVSGFMTYDIYDNMGFTAGADSLNQLEARFTSLIPTRTLIFPSADTPDWEYGGDYGSLSQGRIVAPETGAYIFHLASDDQSELFLSTDDTPANLGTTPICQVTSWSGHADWAGKVSLGNPSTAPQTGNVSKPIDLVQGQSYFFRDLHVEGTGGDGISIGWELPSSHGMISIIPGANLMALMNTDVEAPTLAISRTANGVTVTFTGMLQSADTITGPWTDVPGTSPITASPAPGMKWYRAKQ